MNDLTVFVVSAGQNPNYEDCMKALENQTLQAPIEHIKDLSPIPVALQQMIDRCQTTYYIGVDEDMILHPDAVETLYKGIVESTDDYPMLIYLLNDPHLDFNIYGIKVYKHEVMKRYPYSLETNACDVEQIQRMSKDGYKVRFMEECVGLHSPKWTNELIFERYLNLMEKYKQYRYTWMGDIPGMIWRAFQKNPSQQNICAILGAYTSMISEKVLLEREKDFHQQRPEMFHIRKFFQ